MTLFRFEHEEVRERQVPDVIAVQAGRRQVRIHQYAGAGIELAVWRSGGSRREEIGSVTGKPSA